MGDLLNRRARSIGPSLVDRKMNISGITAHEVKQTLGFKRLRTIEHASNTEVLDQASLGGGGNAANVTTLVMIHSKSSGS